VLSVRAPQLGLNLIEVMISLAVLSILIGLGAPGFVEWLQNQQIRAAAEATLNGLQVARGEAVRRNTPVRFQLVSDLTSNCVLSADSLTAPVSVSWVVSLANPTGACDAPTDSGQPVPPPGRILQKRTSAEGSPNTEARSVFVPSPPAAPDPQAASTVTFAALGNVIANAVSDQIGSNLRVGGSGPLVDRLQWDVKLYLALNGSVHDAAIAAWGLKGRYDGIRPISMIRYLASLGQSSDPSLEAYNKEGLPLVPGLIEIITKDKTAAGGPMAALKGNEGRIAVRAWHRRSSPGDQSTPRVDWILGTTWIPYQLPTFVTPSFQGYISGHSTFSRAAAEVMTGITGSEFFPGGLSEWIVKAGSFRIDAGPSSDIALQWATYYDAADQAGQSRLFGGIHVQADDFTGRIVGSTCGKDAWVAAQRYYTGR